VDAVHDGRAHLGSPGKIGIEMQRIEIARQPREFALIVQRKDAGSDGGARGHRPPA
jgi:hypothetical protein